MINWWFIPAAIFYGYLLSPKSARASSLAVPEQGESSNAHAVAELLEEFVTDSPTPGRFYQVQAEDTPLSVALEALGPEAQAQDAVEYLRCISSGPRWNMPLYATPSTSKQYPDAYMVPGVRIGVRVAFLPRNEDALDTLLQGRMPTMAVDPRTGAPLSPGRSYGLLWMPPVDDDYSCTYEWQDGSSAIDPPPDLFEELKG